MNLNLKLLKDKDVEQILNDCLAIKTESKNIDFKESLINSYSQEPYDFNSKEAKDGKIKIIKDIISMANTQDGGKIIFGINNNFELKGLSEKEYSHFDQSFNDLLNEYTDPPFTCQIYKMMFQEKRIVLIDVPEFKEIPILCKKDAHISKHEKQILKKGQIYIRKDKASSEQVSTAEEMRELLGRAISKKSDELLHNIELLLKGRPTTTYTKINQYQLQIDESIEFIDKYLNQSITKYGYWKIIAHPINYIDNRFKEATDVKNQLLEATVKTGGWSIPFTQKIDNNIGSSSLFDNGFKSYVKLLNRQIESHCAYKSGLFVFYKIFNEDLNDLNKNILYLPATIKFITNLMLFLKQ